MDDKKVSYELDSEYRVRVKDLPPETRPREKFIKYGPQAVSKC
jgi:hypothetical protein